MKDIITVLLIIDYDNGTLKNKGLLVGYTLLSFFCVGGGESLLTSVTQCYRQCGIATKSLLCSTRCAGPTLRYYSAHLAHLVVSFFYLRKPVIWLFNLPTWPVSRSTRILYYHHCLPWDLHPIFLWLAFSVKISEKII